ncbi:MAG: alpha/beta hydrolase [Bryobacteraceae bacterium]
MCRFSFAILFIACLPACAQSKAAQFELPAGVEWKQDLVYSSPGGRDLHLDLYLPKEGKGPFPAVVYIHGGGWAGGNKTAFRRQAAYMATKGFAGACIEYRLSGEAVFPAALDDSKAAVRWVRANAAKYRIDAQKIGAAGGSAGGHLVGMLGTTADVPAFEGKGGNPGVSSRVAAVAAFNPALDLVMAGKTSSSADGAVSKFLGCSYSKCPELWAKASPPTHVSRNTPPFLLLHGKADTTIPYQVSVDMKATLDKLGVRADLYPAEGAKHGFFNSDPWFEPAMKRMEQFFVEVLK